MSKNEPNCEKKEKCKKEPIIALKIYDQCYLEKCEELGPIISDEKCECIILQHCDTDNFGRIILPGRNIYAPDNVCKVKIIGDSFKIKNIEIIDITQSPVNKDYWDVQIRFVFSFKLQMFKLGMQPLKILCCDEDCKRSKRHDNIKDFIRCSVSYIKQVTLFGGNTLSPVMSSDIFTPMQTINKNSPHALIEAKAFPIDAKLKSPKEACNYADVFDDIYEEPITYIFAIIGINAIIRLFRLQSILIESGGHALPKQCIDRDVDPCSFFCDMKFPNEMF